MLCFFCDSLLSLQIAAAKNVRKASECASKHKDPAVNSPTATITKEKNNEEQSKKTATSLILFEEVDVIFDDDSGFLAAIKTFMSTTKRPVILTTSGESYILACVDHMDFTSQIQKSWDIIENVNNRM